MYYLLFLLTLLLFFPSISKATDFYNIKICHSCNYSEAKKLAKEFVTEIKCENETNRFPPQGQCYSSPRKIMIVNAHTGAKFGFEFKHLNRGQPRYMLKEHIEDKILPSDAHIMADNILKTYQVLDKAAFEISNAWQNEGLFSTGSHHPSHLAKSNNTNCNSREGMELTAAAKAAFDIEELSVLQLYTQHTLHEKYGADLSETDVFIKRHFTGATFNVSMTNISGRGSWELVPSSRQIVNQYATNRSTSVAFDVTLDGSTASIDLNSSRTYFFGLSLKQIKQGSNLKKVSDCLLEQLNKYIPAKIGRGRQARGGGLDIGDGSGEGRNGWGLNYGRVGNFRLAYTETCTWTYYWRDGTEAFRFEGSCP